MKELLIIGISAAIVNNVVLSQFLGLCPFFGVSKKIETAAGMGGAVIFVITLSSFVTSLIYKYILANPHVNMQFLQTIVLILVLQDMGIRVPEDISVVGFDDSPYAKMCRPQLTTVRQDVMKKGKMVVKKLMSLIKEEPFDGEERLPVELVVRDSVQNRE